MDTPDFKITFDGTWYHDGAPIKREALAKLFSDRALSVDDDGRYWLKTPYEQYPVAVDDVPYIVVSYEEQATGIDFLTNMGERVPLGVDHALELRDDIPYVEVRDGLYARVGRSVFYHLVEAYGAQFTSRNVVQVLGVMSDDA